MTPTRLAAAAATAGAICGGVAMSTGPLPSGWALVATVPPMVLGVALTLEGTITRSGGLLGAVFDEDSLAYDLLAFVGLLAIGAALVAALKLPPVQAGRAERSTEALAALCRGATGPRAELELLPTLESLTHALRTLPPTTADALRAQATPHLTRCAAQLSQATSARPVHRSWRQVEVALAQLGVAPGSAAPAPPPARPAPVGVEVQLDAAPPIPSTTGRGEPSR